MTATPASEAAAVPLRRRAQILVSTLAVVAVVFGAIGWELLGAPAAKLMAGLAMVVFVALEAPALVRGGRVMLACCITSAFAAWMFLPGPESGAVILRGLANASFVIGLFASVSLLRDAAETSALIQRCGDLMVRQPPGRRYLVLSLGSHMVSVVLNFGVLTLLGAMVQRGNTLESAGGDARIAGIRQQRMLTAILRGYVLMPVWSPLSVAFVVTQTAVPDLDWSVLVPIQFVLGMLLVLLGWAVDRMTFPRPTVPPQAGPERSWRPMAGLAALITAVVAGSLLLAVLLGIRPAVGAMIVVPLSALVWLTVQYWTAGPARAPLRAARRLGVRLTISMPSYRNEFVILGGATFFGTVASVFISPEWTARVIALLPFPAAVVMVLLAWSMMFLARYGVPQIVTVTLLGHAFADLTQHGIDPLVLASGLLGAWGLSGCTTPIGAATLTVARLAGVSSQTVGREWNGRYVLAGAVFVALWMFALDALR